MMGQLEKKVALVTGGTSGIGRAVAIAYAAAGARVVIAGRRPDEGEESVRLAREAATGEGDAIFYRADLVIDAQIEALVAFAADQFGSLDIAFNNAGTGEAGKRFADLTVEGYERIFAVNVRAIFLCMLAEIRQMRLRGRGGAIINTSSIQGHVALGRSAHYTASKHAIEGYTKAAAVDHAADGIRVNAIAPGIVVTPLMDGYDFEHPKVKAMVRERYPVRRVATVDDIVGSAVFLASDAARYVNGVSLPVDGGFLSH